MSPTRNVPASGCSWPTIMRKRVVLPAPLGPITPTMPPGGRAKERSSISSLSPKALRTPLASTTRSPRRGPGGMWISLGSLRFSYSRSSASSCSYWLRRALPLAWRARGDMRTHSSSRSRVRRRRRLGLLFLLQPGLLLLQPGGVVALPGDALAAVELQDPAGDVVEEVAVVGDGDDGARCTRRGGAPARRRTRRRGGWWARRGGGGRGCWRSSRQRATRRRSPPESFVDVGVRRRQPQGVHGDLQGAVDLPGVDGVDLVLDPALLGHELLHLLVGHGLGEAGVDLVEAVEQGAGLGDPLLDVAEDVLGGIEARLLGEVADAGALGGPGLAAEVLDLAGHDLEQRALAGAVQAQDADLGAGEERQPDALEDLPVGRVDLTEVLHYIDVLLGHGTLLLRFRRKGELRWKLRTRANAAADCNSETGGAPGGLTAGARFRVGAGPNRTSPTRRRRLRP